MNLFEVAEANTSSYQARYEAAETAKGSHEKTILHCFADKILKKSRTSINMRPWVLSNLLAGEKHQNIYEWSSEQAHLSGRPIEHILREKLRRYYDRRITFDQTFEFGNRFRYGALNIGGVGASKYGYFCVILRSDFPLDNSCIVYLKADSLREYMNASGGVDVDRISEDVAPHRNRHHLAILKHLDHLFSTEEENWAELLCSDSDYVEVIFLDDVTYTEVEELRVREQEYNLMRELAFADFGRKLNEGECALVNDFVEILRTSEEKGITLRRI